jgi:hypothetical protein
MIMTKRLARPLTLATLLAAPPLLAPAVAQGAVTIVIQRGKQAPSTIYADGDHLRMDLNPDAVAAATAAGGKGAAAGADRGTGFIIVDAAARKMMMVSDRDKSFTEVTEEDMKRMKGQMQAMRAQMAERMKSMTPEQRAQMQAMMGPAGAQIMAAPDDKPHVWKFEPLGAKKTVNGFACETYRVLLDGVPHEEDCISPWSAGLVKRAEFAGLEKFGETLNDNLGLGRGGAAMPLFHQYPGMPISRAVLEAGGKRGEEQQVKSIKHDAIPANTFVAPAGYTKRELPQMGGGMGMGKGPRPSAGAPHPAP